MCNVAVLEIKVFRMRESVDQGGPSLLGGCVLSTQAKRMEMRPRLASK